jgi:hypothetical protein
MNTQTDLVVFNNGKQPKNPHWFAMVLNTEAGREWVKKFKKKNPQYKVKCRYRHSDRRLAYQLAGKDYDRSYPEHVVPKEFAERMAVYIDKDPNKDINVPYNSVLGDRVFKGVLYQGIRSVERYSIPDKDTLKPKHFLKCTAWSLFEDDYVFVTLTWSENKKKWEITDTY